MKETMINGEVYKVVHEKTDVSFMIVSDRDGNEFAVTGQGLIPYNRHFRP